LTVVFDIVEPSDKWTLRQQPTGNS